jgi:transposase
MTKDKYVAMDVHSAITVIEVQDASGKVLNQTLMETKTEHLRDFFTGLSGTVHVTFEEGVQAAWLYDVIKPLVAELIVCNPRENRLMHTGNKSDKVDAHNLADLLRLGRLKSVYHGDGRTRDLKERVRSYDGLSRDCMRVMNRIKAIYRGRGINCKGTAVYREGVREEWVKKVKDPGATDRLDLLYKELDCLSGLRKEARKGLVKEVRRQSAFKVLMQVPTLGPIRIAYIIAIVSTPFRFRTKRQFWPYCGFSVVTSTSSDYELVQGKFRRSKRPIGTRGLNRNYNRNLKYVFKSAAVAAKSREPFKQYYDRLIERNVKPEIARVSLARKISAVTLAVWKKGEGFDANRIGA